jgi:hypothetical protein
VSTPETTVLPSMLRAQRAHVLGTLTGLPDEALRRPVRPSGWTRLGLVCHLALDVERFWFAPSYPSSPGSRWTACGNEGWQVAADEPAGAVLDLYRGEYALADEVIAGPPLDAGPAWGPDDLFEDLRRRELCRTVLHVVTETAAHAGHLDAVHELIDGRT